MYARSSTFQAQVANLDAGIAYVKEQVMPAITGMDGCIGLSLIVDRDSGRCIATSAWADEQSMRASDAALRPIRDEGGKILGASAQVDEWEIALLHRDHRTSDSTSVRCTWLRMDPSRIEDVIRLFRTEVLPTAEQMDGFCSASMMVDRKAGRSVSSVTWDSREAMTNSRETAEKLRAKVPPKVGATIENVGEFDMVLAHLRVPELV